MTKKEALKLCPYAVQCIQYAPLCMEPDCPLEKIDEDESDRDED